MAPTQQSAAVTENNNENVTKSTIDSTSSMVHNTRKESYSSSSSSNNSSVTNTSNDNTHNTVTTRLLGTTQEMLLPISSRGHFFHDTFFEDARQHFEEAVKNVLDQQDQKWNAQDDLTSYRMLRKADLSEESQAATVTENKTCHQVVMDVKDFMGGDVKVKVVDEDEVVVEGSVEQNNGGAVSKKSFRRSFTFPGLVKASDITSTMSCDGVLTVTVPKKEGMHEVRVITNDSKSMESVTPDKKDSVSTMKTVSSKVSKESTSSETSVHNDTAADAKTESCSRTSSSNGIKQEEVSSTSHDAVKMNNHHHLQQDATSESSWLLDSLVPVFPKGPFFHDSFFKESQQHYEEAVKEALDRLGHDKDSQSDDFSLYRRLRSNDMTDESQAVKVTENEHAHQVVLDVRDFQEGDIKVKLVGNSEVEVEGRVEKKDGGCNTRRSFRRRFHLPGVINEAAVTSAVSCDGVLTITAPKGTAALTSKTTCR